MYEIGHKYLTLKLSFPSMSEALLSLYDTKYYKQKGYALVQKKKYILVLPSMQ